MGHSISMSTHLEHHLEEQHPDRFIAIREKYDERLEAIDKKIEELTQENT